MRSILKKALEVLGKDQNGCTEITGINHYGEGSYSINHKAINPTREISVEFTTEKEALAYLSQF